MDDTIYFHLPSYTNHQKLNILLAVFMKDNPDMFYPNVKIGSVYDAFPSSLWNGGRIILGIPYTTEQIAGTYKMFNELGIPLRHTFTNNALKDTDVYDRYCNGIMKLGNNGLNQVLVNSPILEEYIRKTYPDYPIISSTTKRILGFDALNEELANPDYHMVVLDYTLNRDPHIFTLENKDRLEILVDAYCCDDCTRRTEHYKHISETQVADAERDMSVVTSGAMNGFVCQHIAQDFYTVLSTRKSALKVEEIYGFYHQMGFRQFKIEGRTNNPMDVLESYVYYMIRPEYREHARLLLLRQFITPDQPSMIQLTNDELEQIQKNREAAMTDQ